MKIVFTTHGRERLYERTRLVTSDLQNLFDNECVEYVGISNNFKCKYYLFYSIITQKYFMVVCAKNGLIVTIKPLEMVKETYRINDKIKIRAKCKALTIYVSFTYSTTYHSSMQQPSSMFRK